MFAKAKERHLDSFGQLKPKLRLVATQTGQAKSVLDKLNGYLNAAVPEPVFFLTRMWDSQQKAVTYKELREAIQNGFLDEKTLRAWQMDYANFVNEKLKPAWHQAMEAANSQLMAQHPDYFFDPMTDGVRKWTTERGAHFVTAMADEQREAIAAMLDKTFAGDFTVDELSRAIRPAVGLNHIQAKANVNYYKHVKASLLTNNPGMREATAEKRARDASLRYAARQHRQRAHMIATTEMAFAYNKGAHEGIKQAQDQNLMGKVAKVWSTADDERVCSTCGPLDGLRLGMDEDFDFKGKALYSGQKQTPPAHPRCRCAVAYEEIEPPVYPVTPEPDTTQTWDPAEQGQLAVPPEPPLPTIPDAITMPQGLIYKGKANIGGTGEMHLYEDAAGQEWLFKPAQTKAGTPEAFRAYVQEAGYKIQGIVDPETATPIATGILGGKFGTLQKRITIGKDSPNFKQWQYSTDHLPTGVTQQLQREHVTDWLLGNFDSHGGQFIIDDAGRLIGLDKDQAFRYIAQAGSKKMSYAYHPNAVYGETEPIYNTLFKRFAKGDIDLNLQDTLFYIKRVEAIPDVKYREIFRSYAEGLHGKGQAAEDILDQIVDKKMGLRDAYREFYSDLLTVRTGKKQSFMWADEATAHIKQPLAGVMHDPALLGKMSIADLKQLAKQKQMPYYTSMNKSQLIDSISDPAKAPGISAQVRDRLAATRAARNAAPVNQAKEKTVARATDIFSDMAVVPENRIGIPVRSDGPMLEGMNLTARRMNIGGTDYYEISGKLTHDAWSATWNRLKPLGTVEEMFFEVADDTRKLFSVATKANEALPLRSITLRDSTSSFEMYIDSATRQYHGWRGYFRVRVKTSGVSTQVDARNMAQVLDRVGLGELTRNPTAAEEMLFKKTRLVWQNAPARMPELRGLTTAQKMDKIDVMLKEEGIDAAQVNNMKLEEVFSGYSTYVNESTALAKAYKDAGLRYVWAGVDSPDAVVRITKGGLMAGNARYASGMKMTGASQQADFERGGSDSVFTRIGVEGSGARFNDCFLGGRYRIIIEPREMQRTDWYAYTADRYGAVEDWEMQRWLGPTRFIQSMKAHYQHGNEIMFRRGIAKDKFIGISCETDHLRDELLDKFRKAKITEANGIPIDKFVRVSSEIGKP